MTDGAGQRVMTMSGMKGKQAAFLWMTWALCVLAITGGCGYRFYGGGDGVDPAIRTVYVAPFANKTAEADIETAFRNAFIREFIRGARFRVVADRDEADAVLTGAINSLLTDAVAYNQAGFAMQQRMTVSLSLTFTDSKGGRILWRADHFSWYVDYLASATNQVLTDANRKNTLVTLSHETAERAFARMTAGF